jgi:hypothetical protein
MVRSIVGLYNEFDKYLYLLLGLMSANTEERVETEEDQGLDLAVATDVIRNHSF